MALRSSSGTALANALSREVESAVKKAIKNENLPTSKEIKELTRTLKALTSSLKKAQRTRGKAGGKKRGRKPTMTHCSLRGCNRPHYAKGMCASHYNSALRKKKLAAEAKSGKKGGKKTRKGAKPGPKPKAAARRPGRPKSKVAKTCSSRGCNNEHYAKGLCRNHYMAKLYKQRKKSGKK